MITTHIITKNNEKTIERCIKSLLPLQGEIIINDLGSTDSTQRICMNFGIRPKSFNGKDLGKLRNRLVEKSKHEWQLYINAWESLESGHRYIFNKQKEEAGAFNFLIMEGNNLTKDTRLWHKSLDLKFKNPVYETLDVAEWENTENIIFSFGNKDSSDKLKMSQKWRQDSPNSKEAIYYEALSFLSCGKYNDFENVARHYLFKETGDKRSKTMTNYYLATVLSLVNKNHQEAAQRAVLCLKDNCLMAEFWCLLGDIYYKLNKYTKSKRFYENAIQLGGQRLKEDDWPMDISKYKEYPESMIKTCQDLLDNSKIYVK